MKRHVDAVQKSRSPFGLREGQAVLNLLQVGGEVHHQFRPVAKFDQEKFVLGIGGLEELGHGLARLLEFVAHAATGIENQSYGDGRIFARKVRQLLLAFVFKNAEILTL